MELPDWIWDDAHGQVSGAGFSLLVCIVRHGDRDVDPASGGRRWKLKLPTTKLAALAHLPLRTCERAIPELVECRFLWVSKAVRAHAHRNFIVKANRVDPANLAGSPDVKVGHHAGGVLTPSLTRFDRIESTTTTPGPANLAGWLLEEGVSEAEAWIEKYGGERVWRCLYQLDDARERKRDIRSPAGFLYTILESTITPAPIPILGPRHSFTEQPLDYIRAWQQGFVHEFTRGDVAVAEEE